MAAEFFSITKNLILSILPYAAQERGALSVLFSSM